MDDVEELSTSACWSLLRSTQVGRIALRSDADIEVFPVNFIVDHGTIVFRTGAGTKLSLVDGGERATFEADDLGSDDQLVWSVVLKGPIEVIRSLEAVVSMFDIEVSTWQDGPKPTYVRLSPDVITGRRFPIAPS